MAENNTTDRVPDGAARQQHEVNPATLNDAPDFEVNSDSADLANNSGGAQTDGEVEIDDGEDDLSSCYAHSSSYPESLVDDEDAVRSFKQKLLALAVQLNVKFENIGYIRESREVRAFPLTLRDPPSGATWSDVTHAVLRMNGDLALNNRRSRGVQIEDQDVISSDVTREADAPTPGSLTHIYFFIQPAEDAPSLRDIQTGDSEIGRRRPSSVVGTSSDSSSLTGDTLTNRSPARNDADNESDFEDYDNYSDYYVSDTNYYGDEQPQRRDQWERLDEALLSNLLRQHGATAPQTLAFDVKWDNALKRPYAIQSYMPGEQLSSLCRKRKEMSLEDRLCLASEAAELRARLEKIEFQGTGKLQANVNLNLTAGRMPLDMSVHADVDRELYTFGFFLNTQWPRGGRFGPSAPLYYSLYDTMFRAVDDLLTKSMIRLSHIDLEPFFRAHVAFKDMLLDMDHLGWFSKADKTFSMSVLNHGTIHDEQILVERTEDPSNPWRLTGIIGFDEAETVPAVLNKRPWSWVWDVHEAAEVLPREDQFGWTQDVDDLPTDLPYLNDDDLKVKQRYENVLIEKLYVPQYGENAREQYFDDAYGRGRWLRRLLSFARGDMVYSATKYRFNKLISDWLAFKESQNIQPRPLEMWKHFPDYIHGTDIERPGPVQPPIVPSPVVENRSGTVPSSSLQHVYFFINQHASLSDESAAEVSDDFGEMCATATNALDHVYFFLR